MLIEDAEKILSGFQLFRFEVIGEHDDYEEKTGSRKRAPSFQLFRFEVIGER